MSDLGSTYIEARLAAIAQAAERNTSENVNTFYRNSRPKRTSVKYKGYQNRYISWCNILYSHNSFPTQVTNEKVLVYLLDIYKYGAKNAINARKKAERLRSKYETNKIPSYSTFEGVVSALVDLFNTQCDSGQNVSTNHPRSTNVKRFLKSIRQSTSLHDRITLKSKAVGTISEGYNIEQLEEFTKAALKEGQTRTAAMQLFQHSCMMRGDSVRRVELSDLVVKELPNEGSSTALCYYVITRKSKTNQLGRPHTRGILRHKNPYLCAIGLLGVYFYDRFKNRSFPDFSRPSQWYFEKLFCGENPNKEMAYSTHRDSIVKIFNKINVNLSSHSTHAARGSSARYAEIMGATEEQIGSFGEWSSNKNQVLRQSYLTHVSRAMLRILSGFSNIEGTYYVKRSEVIPPVSLQRKVFFQLNEWFDAYDSGHEALKSMLSTEKDSFNDMKNLIEEIDGIKLLIFKDVEVDDVSNIDEDETSNVDENVDEDVDVDVDVEHELNTQENDGEREHDTILFHDKVYWKTHFQKVLDVFEFIRSLRIVILQDAYIYINYIPKLYDDELFNSEEYIQFAREQNEVVVNSDTINSNPDIFTLKEKVNALYEALKDTNTKLTTGYDKIDLHLSSLQNEIKLDFKTLYTKQQNNLQVMLKTVLNCVKNNSENHKSYIMALVDDIKTMDKTQLTEFISCLNESLSSMNFVGAQTPQLNIEPSSPIEQIQTEILPQNNTCEAFLIESLGTESTVSLYIPKKTTDLLEIWKEYTDVIIKGIPLKALANSNAVAWRGGGRSNESKIFKRRYPIWKAIEFGIQNKNYSVAQCIEILQAHCSENKKGLTWLSTNIPNTLQE